MASISPPVTPAQAGSDDPDFDTELERFERRLRYAREHRLFGVHPDGVGPTLGQDLGKPNPGDDLDWVHMAFNLHR
jgi:hypothetical protein